MRNPQLSTQEAKAAIVGALTGSAMLWVGHSIYTHYQDRKRGKYSEQECQELNALKRVYKRKLFATQKEAKTPIEWELTADNFPTHVVYDCDWFDYVQQLADGKRFGPFHVYAKNIADMAAKYLDVRAGRVFSKGRPGDIVEKFFCDWMSFALQHLAQMPANDMALEILQKRLDYLDAVFFDANIFDSSFIERDFNKTNVMFNIRRQLQECMLYARDRIKKTCARDSITQILALLEQLLQNLVGYVYFCRQQAVYQTTLAINQYAGAVPNTSLTTTDKIYRRVQGSATGRLLYDFIRSCSLSTFGVYEFSSPQDKVAVDYDALPADLPPWVSANGHRTELKVIEKIIRIGKRLAQASDLLRQAHYLTGIVGDNWALGEANARQALYALLQALAIENNKLQSVLMQHRQHHCNLRRNYKKNKNKKGSEAVFLNFAMADVEVDSLFRSSKQLKRQLQSLRERVANFPEDAKVKAERAKREFYQGVYALISKYYAKHDSLSAVVSELLPVSQEEKPTANTSLWGEVAEIKLQQQEARRLFSGINWPKRRFYHFDFTHTARVLRLQCSPSVLLAYHHALNNLHTSLERSLDGCLDAHDIRSQFLTLQQSKVGVADYLQKIMPRWQLGLRPLRLRLGWPFNSKCQQAICALQTALGRSYQQLTGLLTRCIVNNAESFRTIFSSDEIDAIAPYCLSSAVRKQLFAAESKQQVKIVRKMQHPSASKPRTRVSVKTLIAAGNTWQSIIPQTNSTSFSLSELIINVEEALQLCQQCCLVSVLSSVAEMALQNLIDMLRLIQACGSSLPPNQFIEVITKLKSFANQCQQLQSHNFHPVREALLVAYQDLKLTSSDHVAQVARQSCRVYA